MVQRVVVLALATALLYACAARGHIGALRINGNRVATAEVGQQVLVTYFYPGAPPEGERFKYDFVVGGVVVSSRELDSFVRWLQFAYTPTVSDYYEAFLQRPGQPYTAEFVEDDFRADTLLRGVMNVEVAVAIRVYVDDKLFDTTHGGHLLLGCMSCKK